MDRKLIDGVFRSIIRINLSETKDSIPNSITFPRLMLSQYGIDAGTFARIISILNDSHKIFVFEIQHSNTDSSGKIEGYVDADITTIRKLITAYSKILVNYYKDKYGKEVLPQTIIKELLANMSYMMNTEIGMAANKFIIFSEYEKLIQKQYQEYTEEWKEKKLLEILKQQEALSKIPPQNEETDNADNTDNIENTDTDKTDIKKTIEDNKEKRLIDTPEYKEYDHKKNEIAVEKLLNIYGVEFFTRVHFRKCEFALVERTIKTKAISRKNDLLLVKKMLETVKSNIHLDKNLADHIIDIHRLEKVIGQHLT